MQPEGIFKKVQDSVSSGEYVLQNIVLEFCSQKKISAKKSLRKDL